MQIKIRSRAFPMQWLTFLQSWWQRAAAQRPDLHIILYTRENCPLCDEAGQVLHRFRRRYGFHLETRDVDGAAELQRLYGNWVPVVTINEQLRFRGHVNPVLLQRILDAPSSLSRARNEAE